MHKNIKPNQSETLAEVIQCSEILRIWTYYLSLEFFIIATDHQDK